MLHNKIFLLISLFILKATIFNEDCIKWTKDRKIRWEDFKGETLKKTYVAATSSIGIVYKTINQSSNKYLLEVYAEFEKNKSSILPEKKSDKILEHEQKHFDFAELYARKIRKLLISNNPYNRKDISEQIAKLMNQYSDSLTIMNSKYDFETNHSLEEVNQIKWNNFIKNELSKLEKYSYRYVTIYLKN